MWMSGEAALFDCEDAVLRLALYHLQHHPNKQSIVRLTALLFHHNHHRYPSAALRSSYHQRHHRSLVSSTPR